MAKIGCGQLSAPVDTSTDMIRCSLHSIEPRLRPFPPMVVHRARISTNPSLSAQRAARLRRRQPQEDRAGPPVERTFLHEEPQMDDRTFDRLAKGLAQGRSRRSLLKGMIGIGS